MKLTFAKQAAAASALVLIQLQAGASPIAASEYVDAGTGLHWLRLSETVGLSIQDFVAGQDGWNGSYRLAEASEIQDLLQRFSVFPTAGVLNSPFGAYVHLVGGTTPEGMMGSWFHAGSSGAIGRSYDAYVSVTLFDGDMNQGMGECPAYFDCQVAEMVFNGQDWNVRDDRGGLFLIRQPESDVPEPGTLALLGLGGLAALRRRSTT